MNNRRGLEIGKETERVRERKKKRESRIASKISTWASVPKIYLQLYLIHYHHHTTSCFYDKNHQCHNSFLHKPWALSRRYKKTTKAMNNLTEWETRSELLHITIIFQRNNVSWQSKCSYMMKQYFPLESFKQLAKQRNVNQLRSPLCSTSIYLY